MTTQPNQHGEAMNQDKTPAPDGTELTDLRKEIDRLNDQRRALQTERETLLERLAASGVKARMEEAERWRAEVQGLKAELGAARAKAEPWGWALVDKDGNECGTRAASVNFFGGKRENPPYEAETLAHADREWPGLAPHRIVTLYAAPQPTQAEPVHPDDAAVDRFAAAMKAKMAASRAKGRSGWDDPAQCSVEYLAQLLVKHVAKGDPVDVGNFAMMLHQRGAESEVLSLAYQTAPPPTQAKAEPYCWAVSGLVAGFYGEFAEQDARATARRCGGTAEAFPLYRHAQAQAEPVTHLLTEAQVDDYIEDYEWRGEDASGRDVGYTPTAAERALIKDAIMGLIGAAPQTAPQPAQAERQPLPERAILDLMPTTIPASMAGELLWFARALERAHGIGAEGGAA